MKKILVFSHTFPPALDGGSQILARIAAEFVNKGKEVVVVTSDAYSTDDFIDVGAKRLEAGWNRGGKIPILRLKTLRWLRKPLRLAEKLIPFKTVKDWLAVWQTGPIFFTLPLFWLRQWRPDRIIAGVFPTTIPVYARFLSWWTGAKLVVLPCFHVDDKGFYKRPLIDCFKKADKIIALTSFERNFYTRRFRIALRKIHVYRPPVAKELIMEKSEKAPFLPPPTILFLGNQAAHKRIEFLIDAFVFLGRKFPQARLIIAGRKTLYSPIIKARLASLPKKARQRIKVIDGYDRQKEIELLDKAWVLVNSSIHESLGLVFLEAWARKKPVIAADLPTTRELIADGKDGLLFDKDDTFSLADKITKLLENKKQAQHMGEAGFKKLAKE